MTTLQSLYQDNRILTAIIAQRERLTQINMPMDALDAKLSNLSPAEIRRYNDTRAIAQAGGKLSHAESDTIYAALGPSGWTDRADLAAKIVILHVMGELLNVRR